MFHKLGRFILVRSEESTEIIAFTSFRFEEEEGFGVVYWWVNDHVPFLLLGGWIRRLTGAPHSYELHVSPMFHRCGLGRKLTQMLFDICKQRGLDKVMLTAFIGAVSFVITRRSPHAYRLTDPTKLTKLRSYFTRASGEFLPFRTSEASAESTCFEFRLGSFFSGVRRLAPG